LKEKFTQDALASKLHRISLKRKVSGVKWKKKESELKKKMSRKKKKIEKRVKMDGMMLVGEWV
jgi:hypothetical protein